MTNKTQTPPKRLLMEIEQLLFGRECWYVACGGCVGTSFQLALGKRVQRAKVLTNPVASPDYRQFEGEFGLLVWCSWRLVRPGFGMTSSEDEKDVRRDELLRSVSGRAIADVDIRNDWQLWIKFDDQSELTVFADNVGPSAVIDTNWEAWSLKWRYSVTSELDCVKEHRCRDFSERVMTVTVPASNKRKKLAGRRPQRQAI
jgi:hypothetical protein